MNKIRLTTFIGLAILASVPFWGSLDFLAFADEKTSGSKHDDVLEYRQKENILPFEEIFAMVKDKINGEIIKTEFEIEDGIPVYEFKYIDESGRVLEIYADARTGVVVKKEQD